MNNEPPARMHFEGNEMGNYDFNWSGLNNVMHLSILCPTTPHPGYIGGKVGHLPCFDTKTCPTCGEFDRLSYACATIKSTDDQIPHLFLDY